MATFTPADEATQDLGEIQSEDFSKVDGIEVLTSIEEDSTENELVRLSSPVLEISVSGIFTGTVAECRNFARWLEARVNGQQKIGVYFSDLMNKNYNVIIKSARWNWRAGSPNEVEYSLVMNEGKEVL